MLHYLDKKCIVGVFLLFSFCGLFGQNIKMTKAEKKILRQADDAFDFYDYLNAMNKYKQLYHLDTNNMELNYKLGVCTYNIKKFRKEAKKYFLKVNATDYLEVNYYLGKLYHLERNYEKAIAYLTQYRYLSSGEEHSKQEIDDLIGKSNTAILFETQQNSGLEIKNMGEDINTEYAEYAPLIPADGNFMMFTSRRKNLLNNSLDPLGDYFEDIFIAKKTGDKWETNIINDTLINTRLHDACTGLSADGESMLLYRTSKDLKSGDIYESTFSSSKWSEPHMLGTIVNAPDYIETSACYSPDGNVIYFSSNREGGYGGMDLYYVKKLPNGKWAEPKNLGPKINTIYNEDAPFVHPFENVLYFSSEGNKNMGGYDIFKSEFDEMGVFTSPVNLGSPINTVDDDLFFVMSTDGSTGYFSSERTGGFGSQDIYSVYFPDNNIPLDVYNVFVFDEFDNVLKDVEIVVTDMKKKSVYGTYKSNSKTGKVLIISKPDVEYSFTIQCPACQPLISTMILNKEKEIIFRLKKK